MRSKLYYYNTAKHKRKIFFVLHKNLLIHHIPRNIITQLFFKFKFSRTHAYKCTSSKTSRWSSFKCTVDIIFLNKKNECNQSHTKIRSYMVILIKEGAIQFQYQEGTCSLPAGESYIGQALIR